MSVRGWTEVYAGGRTEADLLAAMLEARGLKVEVLGERGPVRVFVPDAEARLARELMHKAEEQAESA